MPESKKMADLVADLRALLLNLRSEGLAIGIDQFLAVEQLLILTAVHARLVDGSAGGIDVALLKTLVAPIVCSSAAEQQRFYQDFDTWLVHAPPAAMPASPEVPAHEGIQRGKKSTARLERRRAVPYTRMAIAAGGVAAAGAALLAGLGPWAAAPLAAAAVGLEVSRRATRYWTDSLAVARRSVNFSVLRRTERLAFAAPPLFRQPDLSRRLARIGMARQRTTGTALDARRTVDQAASQGAATTLVFQLQPTPIAYLMLVDHRSYQDQQAQVLDDLVEAMREQGATVDCYRFFGNPRVLWRRDRLQTRIELAAAAVLHQDHILVVATDGAGLVDLWTGAPQPWLRDLAPWQTRVAFVPNESDPDSRGRIFSAHGFALVAAEVQELVRCLETVAESVGYHGNGRPLRNAPGTTLGPYPPMLGWRWREWLDPAARSGVEIDQLMVELHAYLGETDYQYLAACAVFPGMSFPLTKYLIRCLTKENGKSADLESTILRLMMLPWFRFGAIPTRVRQSLIAGLTPESAAGIRRGIEQLLVSGTAGIEDRFELELALRDSRFGIGPIFRRLVRRNVAEPSATTDPLFLDFFRTRREVATKMLASVS